MPYLVGEMGPELFMPGRGGNIVPNDQLGRGGGASIVINVNTGMGSGNGAQIGESIVNAIRKYERTSGPVFARA
jgi:phage-related minor tail protein